MRLWTNDNGTAWRGQLTRDPKNPKNAMVRNLTYLKTGLAEGTSDIVGFTTKEITPEMVGQKIAVFTAIEVKTENDVLRPMQKDFLKMVRDFGGIAGVAYSIEDAEKIIKGN